ncbi:MAG: MarR family transcriptional regulator [Bacilli bacterium]|jgi:DNA-binding MarR family transcriptional regulator|nr:MarR family transcriptional regulator [Bacilli bacterium]MDD3348815.1 MarR family transcriptional regulator [Bacilli bacterium]MDD4056129.1 MarR family transcriptional regulator [Bacilli bacterium]MDY0209276.1 MarR family transcriptional regulator [Bacilli bacterium]
MKDRNMQNKNMLMLINELSRIIRNWMRIEADKVGVIATYRPILMMLSYQDGITQLDIAKYVHMAPPTISLTLQKMEASKLVRREEDAEDKRQIRIYITEEGRKLDQEMKKIISKIERVALIDITSQEQKVVEEILKKTIDNLLSFGGFDEENY